MGRRVLSTTAMWDCRRCWRIVSKKYVAEVSWYSGVGRVVREDCRRDAEGVGRLEGWDPAIVRELVSFLAAGRRPA